MAFYAYAYIGRFGPNNQETLAISDLNPVIKGSIAFQDWDKKELQDFVLDSLKHVYQRLAEEIEVRKNLIAEEEAEQAKYARK